MQIFPETKKNTYIYMCYYNYFPPLSADPYFLIHQRPFGDNMFVLLPFAFTRGFIALQSACPFGRARSFRDSRGWGLRPQCSAFT